MSDLFTTGPGEAPRVVGVAVAAGVWGDYDYLWPASLPPPQVGLRVRVPFGKGDRAVLGFVTAVDRPAGPHKLKAVAEALDTRSQLDATLWDLAAWICRYYLSPLGMTLAAMVPSAVGRHGRRTETVVTLTVNRKDWPARLGARQMRLLDELWEARHQGVEPLPLEQLLSHGQASRDTIRRLAARGLVRTDTRPVTLEALAEACENDPFDLNDDQRRVLDVLGARLDGGFSVTLLHGVTGSGKTEVYLRAIRQVIAAGRQAILLVPEIALATQTLQRLCRRLPGVAVLHSGLSSAQRAFHYDQIRDGHAHVVIGPRSAVFAPTRRLGLLVVDEEHEGSYKQDTAPRYHGRDVAIKRASLENVPVLLGSATPSLESLVNAQAGKYDLLTLPARIRSLPMPRLSLVELRKDVAPGKLELIGATLGNRIAAVLDRSEQIILLMNRRGYASYCFCPKCSWQLTCRHCSRPMVFHQAIALGLCHYCDATAEVPRSCPACSGKLVLFGMGIQRIEAELARKFPQALVARMDSDTMTSPVQFRKVLEGFRDGAIDILLGTQMVAKGLDFPKVTLVGVVSADTALAVPDFRADERTFQLIVQVAGRAGRSDRPGEVIVQTLTPDNAAIRLALAHDYAGFAAHELPLRESVGLPPYVRLVRFVVRHHNAAKAQAGIAALDSRLRRLLGGGAAVRFEGPMQAGVYKIRNQFRWQLNCYCVRPGLIQNALLPEMGKLSSEVGAEVVADVDPVSLL